MSQQRSGGEGINSIIRDSLSLCSPGGRSWPECKAASLLFSIKFTQQKWETSSNPVHGRTETHWGATLKVWYLRKGSKRFTFSPFLKLARFSDSFLYYSPCSPNGKTHAASLMLFLGRDMWPCVAGLTLWQSCCSTALHTITATSKQFGAARKNSRLLPLSPRHSSRKLKQRLAVFWTLLT